WIFPGNRSPGPALYRIGGTRAPGTKRRPAHNDNPRRLVMLRGFFLIFLLTGVAIVAVFGLRGQKSTGSPIEVFPDMVRQPKVRAQAPLGFFADGRGAREPVAGTVPIGYEMPQMSSEPSPGAVAEMNAQPGLGFSGGTDYYN